MPKIQVLDKHTAELIAAGEVVERPSSVVKELMENAIDAGASTIKVEIENGGTTFIRISDDGSGIESEDVPTAFLRHATSKVQTGGDLEAIGTLGFRGEALASVCAVARVELVTCVAGKLSGTRYVVEGGDQLLIEDAARPQGTTIIVRDLFYNVPARMKFLKKDVTEANSVAGVVDRIALSHPEISVRFIKDGKEELLTPGDGQLLSCIYTVFGRDFAKGLKEVDYTLNGVRVRGFVSKPESGRANRTMQHFFVNNRYVKTRTAMAALEQAFKGLMMTGKFPCCVIFMDMPLQAVDVNVHPAKIEVRFINERPIFDAVYHGVKSALQSGVTPAQMQIRAAKPVENHEQTRFNDVLSAKVTDEKNTKPVSTATEKHIPLTLPSPPTSPPIKTNAPSKNNGSFLFKDSTVPTYNSPVFVPDIICDDVPNIKSTAAGADNKKVKPPQTTDEALKVNFVGEVFSTYIIARAGDSLYFIDKHAAHERILYNKLKSTEHNDAQLLIEPVIVTLNRDEYAAILPELDTLQTAGFEVEDFGGHSILVRALPMMLDSGDAADIICEIAGAFVSGRNDVSVSKLDRIYYSAACRAAIRAGDVNKPDELQAIAHSVLFDDSILICPHGRPVCFELTLKDIEKQFGRTK